MWRSSSGRYSSSSDDVLSDQLGDLGMEAAREESSLPVPYPSVGAVRAAALPQQRPEQHHVGHVEAARELCARPVPCPRARAARVPDFLVQGLGLIAFFFSFFSFSVYIPSQRQWGDFELLSPSDLVMLSKVGTVSIPRACRAKDTLNCSSRFDSSTRFVIRTRPLTSKVGPGVVAPISVARCLQRNHFRSAAGDSPRVEISGGSSRLFKRFCFSEIPPGQSAT